MDAMISMYRQQAGLTKSALARLCNVERQTVGDWEAGRTRPDIARLPLLASVLGVPIEALLSSAASADVKVESPSSAGHDASEDRLSRIEDKLDQVLQLIGDLVRRRSRATDERARIENERARGVESRNGNDAKAVDGA